MSQNGAKQIKRAIISVSDKTGLIDFAKELAGLGVEIVSTGSTAKSIREAGIKVTEVSEVTNFAEALDGRVKTLHPAVHAGLLADIRKSDHIDQLLNLGIKPFDLAVVNLYPFAQTVASGATPNEAIEQVDIGGPAMIRAAAKNHHNVAVVVDPKDYEIIINQSKKGGVDFASRKKLAAKAYRHTANYDSVIAKWFAEDYLESVKNDFPDEINIHANKETELRYGENSHQKAMLYTDSKATGLAGAKVHGGKALSYNNLVDAEAAVRAAYDHNKPAVAIIKHANPCGIAVAKNNQSEHDIADIHMRAHNCDSLSAFGGVIATNSRVSVDMAKNIAEIFTEVVVAPDYEPDALAVLLQKKNLRVVQLPESFAPSLTEIKQISGGFLLQETDFVNGVDASKWRQVSGATLSADELGDLEFAWRACRAVKSNAILLAKEYSSVGIGMGQVNRVDSCNLAVIRAGNRAAGSYAASDAFFPFADGLEVLIDAGVKAVVQPGGSVRDNEIIEVAKNSNLAMFFTGERHFFH